MRILLTGAEGFIGRNLRQSTSCETVTFSFSGGDIDTIDFRGIDAVVHLAALVHRMVPPEEREYFRINRDQTLLLAGRAKEAGVRQFLFMSTVKVYGETSGESCLNEQTPCFPSDPYGRSKLEAEKGLRALEDEHFAVTIVRTPIVYGPGVKANILSLIRLVEKLPLLPLGGIRNKRSFVYVGNLTALIDAVLAKKASGIFLASDAVLFSTSSLVGQIAKALGVRTRIVSVPWLGALLKRFRPALHERLFGTLCVDASATNRRLGFIPPYSAEAGWMKTIEWYRNAC